MRNADFYKNGNRSRKTSILKPKIFVLSVAIAYLSKILLHLTFRPRPGFALWDFRLHKIMARQVAVAGRNPPSCVSHNMYGTMLWGGKPNLSIIHHHQLLSTNYEQYFMSNARTDPDFPQISL